MKMKNQVLQSQHFSEVRHLIFKTTSILSAPEYLQSRANFPLN